MNRRELIRMAPEEVAAFLAQQRTIVCATNGVDGFAHLMPLWFVVRGDGLWAWTFAKSQKVRNLERDPRATLQVDAGSEYHELRGVMLKCDVTIERDEAAVAELGLEIFERCAAAGVDDEIRAMVRGQAPKRVGLRFVERARATWDHRKLPATAR